MSFLVFATILVANVTGRADTLNADLKVCIQSSDGKPLRNATVVLKGGRLDVKLNLETDQCYHNRNIFFDTTKDYSIEVVAEGYKKATKAISTAGITPDNEFALDPIVLATQASPSDSPSNQPTAEPTATPRTDEATQRSSNANTLLYIATALAFLMVLAAALFILWRINNAVNTLSKNILAINKSLTPKSGASGNLTLTADWLGNPLNAISQQQKIHAGLLQDICVAIRESGPARAENGMNSSGGHNKAAVAPHLSDKEKSDLDYKRFLNGEAVFPEPLHLSDVGGSSVEDLLGGRTALLQEHAQGGILLFRSRETDSKGWIYPDTNFFYSEAELKSVFKTMTRDQFECLKSQKSLDGCTFQPIAVKQVPNTQTWQLETSTDQV